MFSIIMPFGAIATDVKRKRPPSPLVPMCEVTGGRAFTAQHLKHALQLIETIATQKLQSGVNVVFDALPPLSHRSEPFTRQPRKMLLVPIGTGGWWPIAEAHGSDAMQNKNPLPSRAALPVLRVATTDANPSIPENFPFDKYELEPSELSDYVRRELLPSACWPCLISGSGGSRGGRDEPCAFLRAPTGICIFFLFLCF